MRGHSRSKRCSELALQLLALQPICFLSLVYCTSVVRVSAQSSSNPYGLFGSRGGLNASTNSTSRAVSQRITNQAPVFRADLYVPCQGDCSNALPDAASFFNVRSPQLIQYRILLGVNWTLGWNDTDLLALYSIANTTSSGEARLVAVFCGPENFPRCGPGTPGKPLIEGNLTQDGIAQDSPLDMADLQQMMKGYFAGTSSNGPGNSGPPADAPDAVRRAPAIQVLAQAPTTQGQSSQTVFSGLVYPTNAASLPDQQVPYAVGARLDAGTPYHTFLWPVPGTNSTAAGSISVTLYNDSSLAYSIVIRRIDANDSITSSAIQSVNPALLNSSVAFTADYFAYTQRGCCGGQAPNFFTSYPTGLQAPPDGQQFLLASAEWPPPSGQTKRELYLQRLIQDLQNEDFAVAIRLRTKGYPDGLLLGEFVLGCGPDGLGLPMSAACTEATSGARRRKHRR